MGNCHNGEMSITCVMGEMKYFLSISEHCILRPSIPYPQFMKLCEEQVRFAFHKWLNFDISRQKACFIPLNKIILSLWQNLPKIGGWGNEVSFSNSPVSIGLFDSFISWKLMGLPYAKPI